MTGHRAYLTWTAAIAAWSFAGLAAADAPVVLESRNTVAAKTAPTAATEPAAATTRVPATEAAPLGPRPKAAQPAPTTAPAPAGASALGADSLRTIAVLAAVVLVAAGCLALLRNIARRSGGLQGGLGAGGRAPSGILEIIGRYPAGPGVTLVLMKLDRRILLLSQSARGWGRGGGAASFTTLCEITDPEEVASILMKARDERGESLAERFNGLLRDADGEIDRAEDRLAAAPEPKPVARRVTPENDGAALVEALRGQIPVVDLTARASAREKQDWESQLKVIRERIHRPGGLAGQPRRPKA